MSNEKQLYIVDKTLFTLENYKLEPIGDNVNRLVGVNWLGVNVTDEMINKLNRYSCFSNVNEAKQYLRQIINDKINELKMRSMN